MHKKKPMLTRKNFLIFIGIVIIALLAWFHYSSKKTQILKIEDYEETYDAEAVIIRNEMVVNLNEKIDLNVKEGQRVSMNQVIANGSNALFSDYYHDEIDIINWILENNAYNEESLFSKDLEKIDKEIEKIDKQLELSETFKQEEKIKELKEQKDELLKKRNYIVKSFQYIGADKETLLALKEEYSGNKGSSGSSVTLKKLNFEFPGYIYFSTDGYENLLGINVLEFITPDYIRDLDDYNTDVTKGYSQTIKVIDDTYFYLAVILPKDVELSQEERFLKRRDEITKSLGSKDDNIYYDYLNSRYDVLKTMPTITYQYNKVKYQGKIVDIKTFGEEKILLIQARGQYSKDFFTTRKIDINLVTYNNDGFIIPKRSITKVDGKDHIVILNKGSLRKYIEVDITREKDTEVLLDDNTNQDILEGMQLIINP